MNDGDVLRSDEAVDEDVVGIDERAALFQQVVPGNTKVVVVPASPNETATSQSLLLLHTPSKPPYLIFTPENERLARTP